MTTNTNMPLEYQEILDILRSSTVDGIAVSCLETRYKEKFKRSPDYNSLGVDTIEDLLAKMQRQGLVFFYEHPKSDGRYVTYARFQKIPDEFSVVCLEIEYMLESYSDGMPVSCLETSYKEKFERSLDYNSLGLETIEELIAKMSDKGMVVLFDKDQDKYVKWAQDMRKESTTIDVYDKIQYMVGQYSLSVTMSLIEKRYYMEFEKSLDYGSLGVEDFKELIGKMRDKGWVLVYEDPDLKETFVMCAWLAESLRKFLKSRVKKLLDRHSGKIPFRRFEALYKDMFSLKLDYYRFGLKDLDHLCQVLNLGIEADSQGDKVIKAGKSYNLRKRKRNLGIEEADSQGEKLIKAGKSYNLRNRKRNG